MYPRFSNILSDSLLIRSQISKLSFLVVKPSSVSNKVFPSINFVHIISLNSGVIDRMSSAFDLVRNISWDQQLVISYTLFYNRSINAYSNYSQYLKDQNIFSIEYNIQTYE